MRGKCEIETPHKFFAFSLAVCLLSIFQYHCLHYITFNKNIVIECINIFICEWILQKLWMMPKIKHFNKSNSISNKKVSNFNYFTFEHRFSFSHSSYTYGLRDCLFPVAMSARLLELFFIMIKQNHRLQLPKINNGQNLRK